MRAARTIALLGGGQLGRMFIENALRYDVSIHVLDPDPGAPCAALADRFAVGDLNDPETVMRFASDADIVGIEIEHVSTEALTRLKASGKRVIPDPDVLRTIKDKGLQKQFYRDHGIPTSEFALVEGIADINARSALLPAFLKQRTGGYDGKGVMALNSVNGTTPLLEGPCVLEKSVDVAMELAVLVVRSWQGETRTYDPVEMVFDPRFNLVDHLRAPARIPDDVARQARLLAQQVANAFHAPGLYAVEMFLTKKGDLLVNETAPRAHNSGHHTIEACTSSQFDQLLRVYMDWPLGDPSLRTPAAMINLVGEDGQGIPHLKGLESVLGIGGTYLHLYGKKETRTGRKMGHVTVMADVEAGLDHAIRLTKAHCRVVPADSETSNSSDTGRSNQ